MPYPSSHSTIGQPFTELQSIDSTNNYALSLAHAGMAEHGQAIFSHEQVAGKGQRGKQWASPKNENIALSVILKPSMLTISDQFKLSACAAVSVNAFFRKYAGEDTTIKWPNDLYWKDRKAGGILIENIIRNPEADLNPWLWAVIGIGININQSQFPAELVNPVSLRQITGKEFDPLNLAKELCEVFDEHYNLLINGGFDLISDAYHASLYRRGQKQKFKKDNRLFEAIVKGVSSDGRLILHHGIDELFAVGELTWLLD